MYIHWKMYGKEGYPSANYTASNVLGVSSKWYVVLIIGVASAQSMQGTAVNSECVKSQFESKSERYKQSAFHHVVIIRQIPFK